MSARDAALYGRIAGVDLKNRAVLVTGAGGFIGSHIAERPVERSPLYFCGTYRL